MSLPQHRCETCKFWDELKRQLKSGDGRRGHCRFHAPGRSTLYTQSTRAHWPTTLDNEWCGKWEDGRREKAKVSHA